MVGAHGRYHRAQELPKKLKDYLQWLATWGKAVDPEEIGQGSGPAQNPPPLDDHSAAVLVWYMENVTIFARDHGLVPFLVRGLGPRGEELEITLAKMNVIYKAKLRTKGREDLEDENA